jgi:hypothetical protein
MGSRIEEYGGPERDHLLVYVRTAGPVPAAEAARLLSALDKAFRAYVRQETGRSGARLVILDIGRDSLWVRLGSALAAHQILSAEPNLLPMFVDSISYALKLSMDHDFEDIPKYLGDLLRSIGQTGKRTMADAIDLVSVARVTLDPISFDIVTRPDTSAPKKHAAESLLALPGWESPEQIRAAEDRVRSGTFVCKLFYVADRWYALPEGMHDVLLPLKLAPFTVTVPERGRRYRIRGKLRKSDEGNPIGIDADDLTPTSPGSGTPRLAAPKA